MSYSTSTATRLSVDEIAAMDSETLDNAVKIAERITSGEAMVKSIVDQLQNRGSITDKQWAVIQTAVPEILNPPTEDQFIPEGGGKITGEVIFLGDITDRFGTKPKMKVKDNRGFTVMGSVPKPVHGRAIQQGDKIELIATLKRGKRSPIEGYYSRPAYAEILS